MNNLNFSWSLVHFLKNESGSICIVCILGICEFQLKSSSDKRNLIHGKLNEFKISLVFLSYVV